MQILFRAFLAIYLAHLLTDFVFQTHRLVEEKKRGKPFAYFLHGLTHYLSAIILVSFFLAGSGLSLRTHMVVLALTVVHLFIDLAKIQLTRKSILNDGAVAYASDQLLHFVSVAFAAWLLVPDLRFGEVTAFLGRGRDLPSKLLLVPVIYVSVIFGGGYLIRALTRPLAKNINMEQPEKAGSPCKTPGSTSAGSNASCCSPR